MKVETVPITSLRADEKNPRVMKAAEAEALKRSLEEFGAVEPAVVNRDGLIIGGHQRILAAVDLGWTEFPVVRLSLSKAKARLLNLALNRIDGEWDMDQLGLLLAEIDVDQSQLALSGFSERELTQLLDQVTISKAKEAAEAGAVPKRPTTKPGDLIRLGDHRLLCGDATKLADVHRALGEQAPDLVYTDPPYGVDYEGGTKKHRRLAGDERGTSIYERALPIIAEVSKPKAALYLWHAGTLAGDVAAALAESGYLIRSQIIWAKNAAQNGALSAQYKQKHEPIFYCHHKGKVPWWFGPTNETTLWEADRAPINEFHSTQKPVELAERALRNSSRGKGLVLDSFGGSGATLIAAEMLDRRCAMLELDPGHCDVIVKRWEDTTGRKARRPKRKGRK